MDDKSKKKKTSNKIKSELPEHGKPQAQKTRFRLKNKRSMMQFWLLFLLVINKLKLIRTFAKLQKN